MAEQGSLPPTICPTPMLSGLDGLLSTLSYRPSPSPLPRPSQEVHRINPELLRNPLHGLEGEVPLPSLDPHGSVSQQIQPDPPL